MGHTMDVLKQVYRLPDDIYQIAKIAKILMLMERGEAAAYKGKTLEKIEVNLDEEIPMENEDGADIGNNLEQISSEDLVTSNPANQERDPENIETRAKNKKRILVPWTNQEKRAVLDFFASHIKNKRPPKRNECDLLKEQHPNLLQNRSWLKIKVFVQNVYTKESKASLC